MMLLEEIFKSKKAENSDHFNLRVHRSISWLKKSLELSHDLDLKFISLWVSFNAIYARDANITQDKQAFRDFLNKICQVDEQHRIYNVIWEKYSQPIRLLLESPYISNAFWDYQNQKISKNAWLEDQQSEQRKVHRALEHKDTVDILFVIFNRLYTLRNQLMHGGATYNSSVNRKQLKDGCNVLSALLPGFIQIVLENANALDLGQPFYPVVQVS